MNVNERARQRAIGAGRDTYKHEVVDYWPACTTCGTTIRHRDLSSRWRSCDCLGVAWACGMNGWEKRAVALDLVTHLLTDGGLCTINGPHPRADCTV